MIARAEADFGGYIGTISKFTVNLRHHPKAQHDFETILGDLAMKILVSAALNGQSTPFLPCSDSSAC